MFSCLSMRRGMYKKYYKNFCLYALVKNFKKCSINYCNIKRKYKENNKNNAKLLLSGNAIQIFSYRATVHWLYVTYVKQ